jgi:hypothetical protein
MMAAEGGLPDDTREVLGRLAGKVRRVQEEQPGA